jgi:hypothetical protein
MRGRDRGGWSRLLRRFPELSCLPQAVIFWHEAKSNKISKNCPTTALATVKGWPPSAACRGSVVCPNWSPTSARCVATSKQSRNTRTEHSRSSDYSLPLHECVRCTSACAVSPGFTTREFVFRGRMRGYSRLTVQVADITAPWHNSRASTIEACRALPGDHTAAFLRRAASDDFSCDAFRAIPPQRLRRRGRNRSAVVG